MIKDGFYRRIPNSAKGNKRAQKKALATLQQEHNHILTWSLNHGDTLEWPGSTKQSRANIISDRFDVGLAIDCFVELSPDCSDPAITMKFDSIKRNALINFSHHVMAQADLEADPFVIFGLYCLHDKRDMLTCEHGFNKRNCKLRTTTITITKVFSNHH